MREQHFLILPEIIGLVESSSKDEYQFTAHSPTHSYPVLLNNIECSPSILSSCLRNRSLADNCCNYLFDNAYKPQEQVESQLLAVLCLEIPLTILLIRTLMWRKLHVKIFKHYSAFTHFFWFRTFWDPTVGFIALNMLHSISSLYLKCTAGYPRPNYYSIITWMQANEDSRKSYRYTASQSFPSGHAEWTMSSCFYISLILWRDASKLLGQHPGKGKVIAFLGVLLLLVWYERDWVSPSNSINLALPHFLTSVALIYHSVIRSLCGWAVLVSKTTGISQLMWLVSDVCRSDLFSQ